MTKWILSIAAGLTALVGLTVAGTYWVRKQNQRFY